MWPARDDRRRTVTCIACGEDLQRDQAREYDKQGDRWDREDKSFEYLCKPCFRELCHLSRGDLEETLVAADAGHLPTEEFLHRYADAVEQRSGQPGHER